MVDRLDLATAVEAHIVHPFLEVVPFGGNIGSALSGLDEIEGALDKVAFARRHGALLVTASLELLQVALGKFGLGVESVDMGWPSLHHQKNAALGFGRVMGPNGMSPLGLKHGGKSQRTKPPAQAIKGFAAGKVGNQVGFVGTHASGFI